MLYQAVAVRAGIATAAIGAVGLGAAYVVARDGSPAWQIVRLVIVVAVTLLAIMAVRQGSALRRAAVGFAVGLLGTAVGIGIALPYLSKAGLGAMSVAGLLCLAGGLVLLVGSGVRLVRLTPGWWKGLTAFAAVIAVFVSVWVIGQSVGVTNVPPTELGSRTPADVGLEFDDVELRTADGVRLSGWYVPSTNGAAVVLAHGAGSTRSAVLDHAVVLARNGYGVLLFDSRGHGDSGGRAMDFGWYGDEDVGAAVDFLAGRSDVEAGRIAAIGMSMGGEEILGAAAGDDRIRAVVAEGATNRVADDKRWLSDEYGVRGWLQERVEWFTFGLTDLLTDADPPTPLREAAAAIAPRPVLLIAGGDLPDEANAGRYIQSGAPASVELWEVEGASHTGGLDTRPDEWEARVTAFLDDALTAGA